MQTEDLEELMIMLSESWVRIEFTKIDGSHRSMLCTRNFVDIPDSMKPTGTGRRINDAVVSVFDLEKQAWRSIRTDGILEWKMDKTLNEH